MLTAINNNNISFATLTKSPLFVGDNQRFKVGSHNDSHNNIVSDHGKKAISVNISTNLVTTERRREEENENKELLPIAKRILIIDKDLDTALSFKWGIEAENKSTYNQVFYEVHMHNDALLALSTFKANFFDLLLIDIAMPIMNGFELSIKILEIDPNPKICFMSSGEVNDKALREVYPSIMIGCFIRKPVTIEYLVKRVKTELE
jgi:CheY-like chemotaxis protein